MKIFYAIAGQSLQDVCMNTYGSINYFVKLLVDNNVPSMDAEVYSNQAFVWDETLVANQATSVSVLAGNIRYATDLSALGNLNFVVPNGGPTWGPPPAGVPTTNKIDMVFSTFYISNADGTTTMVITDLTGVPITGYDLISVELETKPLRNDGSAWSWNKATAVLSLLNGFTADNGVQVYIWYKKTVN